MRSTKEAGRTVTSAVIGRRRARTGARRAGSAAAVVVNVVLLILVNVAPGWSILPFLTPDMSIVLPWINASFAVAIAANLVYLVRDTPRIRGIGDLATDVVGLIATIRVWQVFPFDFGAEPSFWSVLLRVLLAVGIAGTTIAMIVSLVTAVRGGSNGRRS